MSKDKRLGKGIGAIVGVEEMEVKEEEISTPPTPPPSFEKPEVEVEEVTEEKRIKEIVDRAFKEGRVTLWIPIQKAVLLYVDEKLRENGEDGIKNINLELKKLLTQAIAEKYPDVWKKVKEEYMRRRGL
ncbi:MAG: hypothetical protein B6U95_01605 [Thermofilum sp. ex4484_82]|nr:MAG: hypothetical protein B6U95_01605 [Thermofilum sp. ex4484_82]OYT39592.1 MAG: hypothetical protein B6U96_01610 [Archaeoglobales archaeon ex4484_92]